MDQSPLFYDDINDALRDAVKACGGSKVVGCKLWPEKTPEQAARLLSDCLNPARNERLTPEQFMVILRWSRDKDFHGAMSFVADQAGYAATPIDPEDERARLQRQFNEKVSELSKLTGRLERAGILPTLRSA